MLLRLGGIFYKPTAAAIAGTVLCNATLGVFAVAVVLANNDRRAETRAVSRDSSSEQHEAVADSSEHDNATTTKTRQGDETDQQDSAHENKPRPMPDAGEAVVLGFVDEEPTHSLPVLREEAQSPSVWLARIVGSNLCLEDPQFRDEDLQREEAL